MRVDDSGMTVDSIVVQIYCPCMCAALDTTPINNTTSDHVLTVKAVLESIKPSLWLGTGVMAS